MGHGPVPGQGGLARVCSVEESTSMPGLMQKHPGGEASGYAARPHNQASGKAQTDVDYCHEESNFPEVRDLEFPFPVHASVSSVRKTAPGRHVDCRTLGAHGLHCLVLKIAEAVRRTKGLRRKLLTKLKLNCPWAIDINSDTLSSQSTGSPVRIDRADVAYAVEYACIQDRNCLATATVAAGSSSCGTCPSSSNTLSRLPAISR